MPQQEVDSYRKTAAECFNRAWDYPDKKDRDSRDNQRMLDLVHASRYHWSFVGKAANFATADWQVSRAYAALNEPRLALHFAKTALETCQRDNLSDLLPSAYEGMARAYAVAKDHQSARTYLDKAREQLRLSKLDDEDKKVYSDQIQETENLTR